MATEQGPQTRGAERAQKGLVAVGTLCHEPLKMRALSWQSAMYFSGALRGRRRSGLTRMCGYDAPSSLGCLTKCFILVFALLAPSSAFALAQAVLHVLHLSIACLEGVPRMFGIGRAKEMRIARPLRNRNQRQLGMQCLRRVRCANFALLPLWATSHHIATQSASGLASDCRSERRSQ